MPPVNAPTASIFCACLSMSWTNCRSSTSFRRAAKAASRSFTCVAISSFASLSCSGEANWSTRGSNGQSMMAVATEATAVTTHMGIHASRGSYWGHIGISPLFSVSEV